MDVVCRGNFSDFDESVSCIVSKFCLFCSIYVVKSMIVSVYTEYDVWVNLTVGPKGSFRELDMIDYSSTCLIFIFTEICSIIIIFALYLVCMLSKYSLCYV